MNIPQATMDKLAPLVADAILDRAYHEWMDFCTDGYFEVDLNAEVWRQVEKMERTDRLSELLVDRLEQHRRMRHLADEIEDTVREQAQAAMEWRQAHSSIYAMARYHGVSVSDWR